ncbi:MAG: hypothetical protein CM1200mP1_06180 [Candidatus Neomarinimicrobiota bacterium]|nr:MAG: hypothetical protein CM1200mP1_06180 [Candidatus Neomarinimicrobiota bacterium]
MVKKKLKVRLAHQQCHIKLIRFSLKKPKETWDFKCTIKFSISKLPISRMQRDLTDSTTLRNQGTAIAHSYLSLKNIIKGLNRIEVIISQLNNELNDNQEVLAEAIQVILRKSGRQNAYETLKKLSRGKKINSKELTIFINSLNINRDDKKTLLSINPKSYIGLSSKLVDIQ